MRHQHLQLLKGQGGYQAQLERVRLVSKHILSLVRLVRLLGGAYYNDIRNVLHVARAEADERLHVLVGGFREDLLAVHY